MSNSLFNRHHRSSYLSSTQIMKLIYNSIRVQKKLELMKGTFTCQKTLHVCGVGRERNLQKASSDI